MKEKMNIMIFTQKEAYIIKQIGEIYVNKLFMKIYEKCGKLKGKGDFIHVLVEHYI